MIKNISELTKSFQEVDNHHQQQQRDLILAENNCCSGTKTSIRNNWQINELASIKSLNAQLLV